MSSDEVKRGAHIAVFARAPIEGRVKTRLIPAYGARGATAIYRYLAEQTLVAVRDACAVMNATASLWIADAREVTHPTCIGWSSAYGFPIYAQVEGDLGERMFRCLEALSAEHGSVSILGTDCPIITGQAIEKTISQIDSIRPWSLIPVEDGGYVLIATRSASRVPFTDVTWSTSIVMETTRDRFRAAGIGWTESPMLWDIDEPADVERAIREELLPFDLSSLQTVG